MIGMLLGTLGTPRKFARVEDIGVPGEIAFGVGICDSRYLPSYIIEMNGTRIKGSPNYGNYRHVIYNSISCYEPLSYYKITATNQYDIKSKYDFADVAAANAAGYALFRCFIDGGQIIRGFFHDKYPQNSVVDNVAVSQQFKIPATSSGAVTGYGFSDCTANNQTPSNNYGGAMAMAKSRGDDYYTSTSFHDFFLFCIYKAHQQACDGNDTRYAAWNDVAPYAPKGNNNNALKDHADSSITFTSAENPDYSQRALTGSGNPFEKTTHNGQACGIADLNGNMYRISLGLTSDGVNLYTLKESYSFKDLDSTTAFDIANYDNIGANPSEFPQIGGTAGWERLGNSTNQVFSGETDRATIAYKAANAGLPMPNGYSASGTIEFGNDGLYVNTSFPNMLCPLAGLHWNRSSLTGIAARILYYTRYSSLITVGSGSCLSVFDVETNENE